jgi:uncharacterized protein YjdB
MPTYQLVWNGTTRVAKIQNDGDTPGAGFTDLGSFDHFDDADDSLGDDQTVGTENHVLFHHVQDILLREEGIQDMSSIQILAPKAEGISAVIADDTLANAATSQITVTFDPVTTVDKRVTYSSSNPLIASVNAAGLVTAGAVDGTATITVTSKDGGFTDTIVVTVA